MKRCFLAAALGVALIIAGCSKSSDSGGSMLSRAASVLTPSDPWTELALMSAARAKATSWRSKMVMNQRGQAMEVDSEVMCPDRQHTRMMNGSTMSMESYTIGKSMFVNMGGRMMKVPNQMPRPVECGQTNPATSVTGSKFTLDSLPSVKDIATGFQNIEKYKQNMTITKGGVSMVEGSPCQEWSVVYNDPQTKQGYTSNYCVGVADHLPRRMKVDTGMLGKMEITYWDWNSNISINPPTT